MMQEHNLDVHRLYVWHVRLKLTVLRKFHVFGKECPTFSALRKVKRPSELLVSAWKASRPPYSRKCAIPKSFVSFLERETSARRAPRGPLVGVESRALAALPFAWTVGLREVHGTV